MIKQKRLRIFAGPNGSGKSTLVKIIQEHDVHFGVYVNADDIKMELDESHSLNFDKYALALDIVHLKHCLSHTTFYDSSIVTAELAYGLSEVKNNLYITSKVACDDKFPLFLADYIRNLLLLSCDKFTFETVMSHPSKLGFIKEAKDLGYKTYLYFVSLEDSEMNVNRVDARVKQGGHSVPKDRIKKRYELSMDCLLDAIKLVDKAYIFDNSFKEPKLFATSQNEEISLVNSDYVPAWFNRYVINKLN